MRIDLCERRKVFDEHQLPKKQFTHQNRIQFNGSMVWWQTATGNPSTWSILTFNSIVCKVEHEVCIRFLSHLLFFVYIHERRKKIVYSQMNKIKKRKSNAHWKGNQIDIPLLELYIFAVRLVVNKAINNIYAKNKSWRWELQIGKKMHWMNCIIYLLIMISYGKSRVCYK